MKKLLKLATVCVTILNIAILFNGCNSSASNSVINTNSQAKKSNNSVQADNSVSNTETSNETSLQPVASNTHAVQSPSNNKKHVSALKNDNQIVYYVKGNKHYYLNKTAPALKHVKNVLTITLKKAKALGMHQATY